jgi:hypothetical protein
VCQYQPADVAAHRIGNELAESDAYSRANYAQERTFNEE